MATAGIAVERPSVATGAVRRCRRHRKSRIPCDRRKRGMVRRATAGSAPNGTAPQGKVARKCPRSSRLGVSRASGYNLASSGFGSVRCRGVSPAHGTPKPPRLLRRAESARTKGGECGTCGIGAPAGERAVAERDSVARNGPGVKIGIQGRGLRCPSCRNAGSVGGEIKLHRHKIAF